MRSVLFITYLFLQASFYTTYCTSVIAPHGVPLSNKFHKRFEVARQVIDDENENPEKARRIVVYYSFDKNLFDGTKISDESGLENNGMMDVGALILEPRGSTCKSVVYLWDHDIKISASPFQSPPKRGFTVALWTKLEGPDSIRRFFSVRGLRFGSLFLQLNHNQLIWCHLHQKHENYFTVQASVSIPNAWFHLAATYNATTGVAMIFMNGMPLNRSMSAIKVPFSYWGNDVKIGGHSVKEPVKGFVDEFRLYNYALTSKDITLLYNRCHFEQRRSYSKRNEINIEPEQISSNGITEVDDQQLNQIEES